MATGTLDAMYRGGLFDHIGGGFCRYSVDRKWLVPHFEKMLYDNALLLWAYAEAWQLTRKPVYQDVARRTADYVLRELTSHDGAFFCAQDADSEGREGAYYVFTPAQIKSCLGDADGDWFCKRYGITDKGNFEGMSIPNLILAPDDLDEDDRVRALRKKVYAYRKQRMKLGLDDKVLTSWNALMIAALCAASIALEAPEYLEAAKRADTFLSEHLSTGDGGLMLRYREQEAKGEGVLTDYAYMALALEQLYEATQDKAYLSRAESLAGSLLERFSDPGDGGYYLYSDKGEQLVTRPKELWDGAMPSGNSCAAVVLGRLARLTQDQRWQSQAQRQLRFMAGAAKEHPTGYGFALIAVEEALEQP